MFQTAVAAWQDFASRGVKPALDRLRFVGRAITLPGRLRRFDTRFLAAFRQDVAVELPGGGPRGELEELVWLPIDKAKRADVPAITLTMLDELQRRLADDPELKPGGPAPVYRMHRNRFARHLA
ncbi:8-oxo-dGTP pyrophosphatase MutT (NUDIX family) [Mesorhizobium shonense]|uniref:8-oxo-dGTP pyrophosphatase MutT (NUDIX family) n=1 Tax=Mesorhizobium shonense TaxID=1209948 RepID=A0ABV2I5K7_9HYPH